MISPASIHRQQSKKDDREDPNCQTEPSGLPDSGGPGANPALDEAAGEASTGRRTRRCGAHQEPPLLQDRLLGRCVCQKTQAAD